MFPLALLALGSLVLFGLSKASASASKAKATSKVKAKKSTSSVDKKSQAIRKHAQDLLNYVNQGGTNKKYIRRKQQKIGAERTGKPDSQTEKKIEEILGYDVSWRPKRKIVSPKLFTETKQKTSSSAVKIPTESGPLEEIIKSLAQPEPKKVTSVRKSSQTVKPKLLPATIKVPTEKIPTVTLPDSVIAAQAIDVYLRNGGLDRTRVKDYQRRMGSLAIDGVPGPKTKARVENLLHRTVQWPAQTAAEDLRIYYRKGGRNRTKIKAYQNSMGELTVDGLVGPATKKRYKSLTGKTF